jgi:hypothetical protein
MSKKVTVNETPNVMTVGVENYGLSYINFFGFQTISAHLIPGQGYDHVVLFLALNKLDYNLTATSWHSSSGLRGRRRNYRTIL